MIGYLGFKLPPPCIFPRTSSERVSWLSRSRSKSGIGSEHDRDGNEYRIGSIGLGKEERKGWDGKERAYIWNILTSAPVFSSPAYHAPKRHDLSYLVPHSLRFSWTAHLDGLGELTDVTVATMREEEFRREIAGVSSIRAAFQNLEVAGKRTHVE
jgi:hypothetical protein